MRRLLQSIENLKKTKIKILIDKRIKEFKQTGKKSSNEIFKELCFCILTANSTAERCIDVQSKVGNGFLNLSESQLQKTLKKCRARFHTKRAGYISEARKYKNSITKIIKSKDETKAREWLVKNIKGLGHKEASHFLRNIGYDNYAIIDFHIIDILKKHNLITRPKTITKNKYLEIENILKKIANKANLNLAELDLYLWYKETRKVLK